MSDRILISRLFLETCIGVPDAERAKPQRIAVSVEIEAGLDAAAATDNLRRTVDYEAVARRIKEVAAARPRKLIETLAEELAEAVLAFDGTRSVVLLLEKFILPDADAVAVRIERHRKGS